MDRENKACAIQEAQLSCWRRKLFSSADIEQGRHTCWVFVIKHQNTTTKTQFMDVDDFPPENAGCNSFETCGETTWECRVADNPAIIRLKWHYPVREVIYSTVGMLCTLVFGTLALISFFRERRELNKNSDDLDENMMEHGVCKMKEMVKRIRDKKETDDHQDLESWKKFTPTDQLQSIPFFCQSDNSVEIPRAPPRVYCYGSSVILERI